MLVLGAQCAPCAAPQLHILSSPRLVLRTTPARDAAAKVSPRHTVGEEPFSFRTPRLLSCRCPFSCAPWRDGGLDSIAARGGHGRSPHHAARR
jgi:hypothetical protein